MDSRSNLNPIVSWNKFLTFTASKNKSSVPVLARDYALLHIAIYNAVLSEKFNAKECKREKIDGAAYEVMIYLYPSESDSILKMVENISDKEFERGREIGKKVVNYAKTDNSDQKWDEHIPKGNCKWTGEKPIGATCGNQKTLFLSSASEFQVPEPFPCGSPQDLEQVQAVLEASNKLTSSQISIVHKWAALPPPVLWNNMLNNRILNRNLDWSDSARASSYLNCAIYDACVACWNIKYKYWTARPFQRIPNFKPVITTPNFPSYISGHSTMSSAAAQIMSELFPTEKNFFYAQSQEAAISRLWGGIHYPQDNDNGSNLGKEIGAKIVLDMKSDGHYLLPQQYHPNYQSTTSETVIEQSCSECTTPRGNRVAIRLTATYKKKKVIPNNGNAFYNNSFPPRYGWRI